MKVINQKLRISVNEVDNESFLGKDEKKLKDLARKMKIETSNLKWTDKQSDEEKHSLSLWWNQKWRHLYNSSLTFLFINGHLDRP